MPCRSAETRRLDGRPSGLPARKVALLYGHAGDGVVTTNAEKRAEKERNVTAAMLRAALHYDPLTGIFRWLQKAARNTVIGSIAGTFNTLGYLQIRWLGRSFYGHRLAWLYMTGEWPPFEVDHEDTNPSNNKWFNLRPAKRLQNCRNTRRPRHNTSGVKGVSWCKRRKAWRAYIVVGRKQKSLGYFGAKSKAAAAYARAATDTFGEFPRVA